MMTALFATFGVFFGVPLLYFVLGFLLYKVGFKKVGHYLMATSFAPCFGFGSKYIRSKCPDDSKCSNCQKWTCSKYQKGE